MITTSLLTPRAVPAHVEHVMLRMHLPEVLVRRTYHAGHTPAPFNPKGHPVRARRAGPAA
jgi:hypothetical protein